MSKHRADSVGWPATAAAVIAAAVTVVVMTGASQPTAPAPAGVAIAVVGDGYTCGRGSRVVWPTLLAQRTGRSVANFALPRAGFATDGDGGWSFSDQVERALQSRPDTVLFVGGLDDGAVSGTGNIGQGADEAFGKAIRNGVRILVVGPTWYQNPVPAEVSAASAEISEAAARAHAPFLDAVNPPWLTTDVMNVPRTAPTDEGQSLIADKIAAWLQTEHVP